MRRVILDLTMADFPYSEDGKTLLPFDAALSAFALFGFEAKASIDEAKLKEAYRALSRRVHPDRFQRADDQQRENARLWSAAANEAKKILGDPRKTLEALLSEASFDMDPDKIKPPQALLMEVFEINEALDDVEGRAPSDAEAKELEVQRQEVIAGIAGTTAKIAEGAHAFDAGKKDEAFQAWQEVVGRERYLKRILERLEAVLKGAS